MPYYLYRVMPLGVLKKLSQFERFREASAEAKALRAADPPGTPGKVKVMFADNEPASRRLFFHCCQQSVSDFASGLKWNNPSSVPNQSFPSSSGNQAETKVNGLLF